MFSTIKVSQPEKVRFTLSATMELDDWIMLQKDLKEFRDNSFVNSKFETIQGLITDIESMVEQAKKSFMPESVWGNGE